MADVRPFRALRYAPGIDLSSAICPPFDVISAEQQRALYERSPHNAVRIELAKEKDGGRYANAAATLDEWRSNGTLRRDKTGSFYLYRQTFRHGARTYTRSVLFGRLQLEPWEKGIVLPHEQTFGGPKEDRLKLLRATHLNTSPVYLLYRDQARLIGPLVERLATSAERDLRFSTDDGQAHSLWHLSERSIVAELTRCFSGQTLYVADGHHRYETALAYRDEARAAALNWTGDEPENFALAALTASDDPGLLVLPIHRITNAPAPITQARGRLGELFDIETVHSEAAVRSGLAERGRTGPIFGLASAESQELYLLSPVDTKAADRFLPPNRSPAWRQLDYSIANHAILQHCLGLEESQMKDYSMVWFTEDEREAIEAVRSGQARYAVLLNPVPVERILMIADARERMPQKSTFFYPKVPTGLVFNPLED